MTFLFEVLQLENNQFIFHKKFKSHKIKSSKIMEPTTQAFNDSHLANGGWENFIIIPSQPMLSKLM
jgi:hypothetical protein